MVISETIELDLRENSRVSVIFLSRTRVKGLYQIRKYVVAIQTHVHRLGTL